MCTTEFRRKSCPIHCTAYLVFICFCHSKMQAQPPSNRSCVMHKNGSVLFTVVSFQLNLDLKEPILSFSSSRSCIFHSHSFPVDARMLPCPPLKCHWYFFLILLAGSWMGTSGLLCAHLKHPLLPTLGIQQPGLCILHQEMLILALHICLQEEFITVTKCRTKPLSLELALDKSGSWQMLIFCY